MVREVGGFYAHAAKLVKDTDANAALALYLSETDPLMVLWDLLYREACESAGEQTGLIQTTARPAIEKTHTPALQ